MQEPVRADEPTRAGSSWRRLLWSAALVVAVVIAALQIVIGELIPPLIVTGVLLVAGAFLARRGGKAGVIVCGIGALFYLISLAPFVVETFAFPASTTDFVINLISLAGALVILVAAVAILRAKGPEAPSPAAKTFATVMLTLVVVGSIVSIVARLTREDPLGQAGDVDVRAVDTEFVPAKLEIEGPRVAIFIENKDLTAHTFTIDELGVDEAIPGGGSARVEVSGVDPGVYDYYCEVTGHEDMKGTLTIGSTDGAATP
jgi:plastocyanin